MYQLGHYGAALLLYSPVAFRLLSRDEPSLALVGGALAITLATAPDCDHHLPFVRHRTVTHTLVFALLVGVAAGALGWLVGANVDAVTAGRLGRFGFGVGTLTVVSHLLADVLTPMGIRPLWPLSSRRFTLRLVLARNWTANALLFAAGAGATLLVVYASVSG